MRCRYCKVHLAPLRRLTDGEFCCDDHRHAYHQEHPEGESVAPEPDSVEELFQLQAVVPTIADPPGAAAVAADPTDFATLPVGASSEPSVANDLPESDSLLPLGFNSQLFDASEELPWQAAHGLEFPATPQLPAVATELASIPYEPELEAEPAAEPVAFAEPEPLSGQAFAVEATEEAEPEAAFEPMEAAAFEELPVEEAALEETESPVPHPARDFAASWRWINTAWKSAPRDLKVVTVLIPLLMAVALSPKAPAVRVSIPKVGNPDVQHVHDNGDLDRARTINFED